MSASSAPTVAARAAASDGVGEASNRVAEGAAGASVPSERLRVRPAAAPVRVAFVGSDAVLGCMAPSLDVWGFEFGRLDDGPVDVTVVFDPPRLSTPLRTSSAGLVLGVLTERAAEEGWEETAACFDRIVSFYPALSGQTIAGREVWRAISPPVSDSLFGEVRELHARPRVMTIGRWSDHREHVLMPAKHHHDLFQVVHGVLGEELAQLLREFDVGIYVPRDSPAGFAQQVPMHLAAGHLLLACTLEPNHGLERDIDYLHVSSAEGITWTLDRLARFPEMYQRVRIRGRVKAEQFRASRVFARLVHDLLADVAAFGSPRVAS